MSFSSPDPSKDFLRFLGGRPSTVVMKLLLASVIVGFVLAKLDLHPLAFLAWVRDRLSALFDLGFEVVLEALQYLFFGAALVVPVWLALRLIRYLTSSRP